VQNKALMTDLEARGFEMLVLATASATADDERYVHVIVAL